MIDLSKKNIKQLSDKTNFLKDNLEKVLRLIDILELLFTSKWKDKLILKGGTCINLMYRSVDRLSVDIDLDYIGTTKDEMSEDKKSIREFLENALFAKNYAISKKSKIDVNIMKDTVKDYLRKILQLDDNDKEFIKAWQQNIYKPEFLFSNEQLKQHPMALYRLKNFIITTLLVLNVCIASFFLVSCTKNADSTAIDNTVSSVDLAESTTLREPANQYAMDKSTEVETNEPTKAHHIYAEIKLPVEKEIVLGNNEFLTKINQIKNHIDLYSNSTLVVEGMYGWYKSWDSTFSFPMVYRNGPACCGDDQYGGFYMVNLDTNIYALDDWLKVRGKPFMYDHTNSEGENEQYLFLLVESIEVLPTKNREAEMVNN